MVAEIKWTFYNLLQTGSSEIATNTVPHLERPSRFPHWHLLCKHQETNGLSDVCFHHQQELWVGNTSSATRILDFLLAHVKRSSEDIYQATVGNELTEKQKRKDLRIPTKNGSSTSSWGQSEHYGVLRVIRTRRKCGKLNVRFLNASLNWSSSYLKGKSNFVATAAQNITTPDVWNKTCSTIGKQWPLVIKLLSASQLV